jgi:hypothetical protein
MYLKSIRKRLDDPAPRASPLSEREVGVDESGKGKNLKGFVSYWPIQGGRGVFKFLELSRVG